MQNTTPRTAAMFPWLVRLFACSIGTRGCLPHQALHGSNHRLPVRVNNTDRSLYSRLGRIRRFVFQRCFQPVCSHHAALNTFFNSLRLEHVKWSSWHVAPQGGRSLNHQHFYSDSGKTFNQEHDFILNPTRKKYQHDTKRVPKGYQKAIKMIPQKKKNMTS